MPASTSDPTPLSPVGVSRGPCVPSVDTSARAINDAPVELPADDIDMQASSSMRGRVPRDEGKREEAINARKADRGVIVDVPQEPTAEQVEVARGVERDAFGNAR
ncbi:hypothetical protein ACEQ8H_005808 [Pleosporales sp. CAS-2024a]